MPGTYKETVFIDKDNIHLQGVVTEGKWPVLDGESKLNDGILASGHGTVIERMWVKHFKGNGIMTQGANNYRIVNNVVEGPTFYAIFPQFGRNGLVAYNIITKSDDAAIYVGMSDGVDVLYNETSDSIIGIETENSLNTLIEGNYVHDNVMGIAATNLPGLPIKRAENLIIRNNFVVRNNTKNFAPPGAITAGAPAGVGILVLGTDATIVENNLIRDNKSTGVLIAETTLFVTTPDAKLDPFPDRTQILRNMYINNGYDPQDAVKGVLEVAGLEKGVDVLSSGKGRDNCIVERDSITSLGLKKFADCAPGATSAATLTVRPPEPVEVAEVHARADGAHDVPRGLHRLPHLRLEARRTADDRDQGALREQRKRHGGLDRAADAQAAGVPGNAAAELPVRGHSDRGRELHPQRARALTVGYRRCLT